MPPHSWRRRKLPACVVSFRWPCMLVASFPLLLLLNVTRDSACPLMPSTTRRQCLGVERAKGLQVLRLRSSRLSIISFAWLRSNVGWANVWAQASSRTEEDTTDADNDGLPERQMKLSAFLDSVRTGARRKFDYVKMLDNNPSMWQLESIGRLVEVELRRALVESREPVPASVRWSLWIGGQGSVTSMHFDDQEFNCLYVLEGAKRLVLIDPAFDYPCERPVSQSAACWTGVDILTSLPSHAREVTLRAGDAFVIPPLYWHAVENLEPTVAVGINA